MNTQTITALVALLLAATARAQDTDLSLGDGWYIGASGMVVFPDDSELNNTSLAIDFSTGLAVRVGGGYTIRPPALPLDAALSIELEYTYRAADMDQLTFPGGGVGIGGDTTASSFMINFIAEVQVAGGVGLYFGGGVGFGIADVNDLTIPIGIPSQVSDDDSGLAWQLLGGVKVHLDSHWMVYTGGRFWNMDDLNFSGVTTDLSTVEWEFGFRYYF